MTPKNSRYVFVCELGIRTLYDRFKPPSAKDVFEAFKAQLLISAVPVLSNGLVTVKIEAIDISADTVALLFRYTNPNIPEGIAEHADTKKLRTLGLEVKEVPAISAHMLVDINAKYDSLSSYPVIIENVDWLSRSLMIQCLNEGLKKFFTSQQKKPGGKEDLEYSVRATLRGHQSNTLKSILKSGGVLHKLNLETASVKDDGFGEGKYSVVKHEQAELKIQGGPSGSTAIGWLQEKIANYKGKGLKNAKVVIESEGKFKTQSLDLDLQDVTENFLVKQVGLNNINPPLSTCEAAIRVDLIAKMKGVIPK